MSFAYFPKKDLKYDSLLILERFIMCFLYTLYSLWGSLFFSGPSGQQNFLYNLYL